MDHLRNRPTLEINARINDNREFKTASTAECRSRTDELEGRSTRRHVRKNVRGRGRRRHLPLRDEAVQLPSTADYQDFARQLKELTGEEFAPAQLDEIGRNITGIERLINARLGMTEKDDTLPDRWFEEEVTAGRSKGEDRPGRVRGAEDPVLRPPRPERGRRPAPRVAPAPGGSDHGICRPGRAPRGNPRSPGRGGHRRSARVRHRRLRDALKKRLPDAARKLDDSSLIVSVNGAMVLSNEAAIPVRSGDEVAIVRIMAGG